MKEILLCASLLTTLSAGAQADGTMDHAMGMTRTAPPSTKQVGMATMTDGIVKNIDKLAGTITLQHAEVKAIGMPAMTMAYKTTDAALLTKVSPGDKVAFSLKQQADKKYLVDAIEQKK